MPLHDRTIVVTGSARGLGEAFARACAGDGAKTIIIADILATEGKAVAQSLQQEGHDAHFHALDIADPKSIETFANWLQTTFGHVDGLVNNAAIATGIGGKTFEEIDIETWDKVMNVNVRGTWLMIKALAPLLRKSESGGRIVNLASDTALWGAPRLLHYVSSKGAIISMTRALARELGSDSISVNAIAPGLVLVEATEYVPQDRHDLYVQGRAIQRQQHPKDVTGIVTWLMSESSGFVTGQVVPVNGGFVFN